MINKYMKLGIKKNDIDEVTKDVQDILQLSFKLHESSYWGEYNVASISDQEKIRLIYNDVDQDWREEDYKEFPIILEFNRLKNPEEIMRILCDKLDYVQPLYLEEVESGVSTKKYIFQNGGLN